MDEATIRKLAKLARLALTDAEVRALAPELAVIVRHVDALASVDTAGVAPMTHGAPLCAEKEPATRPPRGRPILGRAAVAGSAGLGADGLVRVPRVIE